ncbi:MAG: diguanylate cyclase [Mariprofundaceae bacterium]|nr:diguanylate cyclase [Mariprofundaceae bacterium]
MSNKSGKRVTFTLIPELTGKGSVVRLFVMMSIVIFFIELAIMFFFLGFSEGNVRAAVIDAVLLIVFLLPLLYFLLYLPMLRQTDSELNRVKLQLEEAQSIAHIGSWEWSIRDHKVYWSDEIYRVFGVSRSRFNPGYDNWLSLVHPDDREQVEKAFSESLSQCSSYDIEYRIVRPDGTERFIHAYAVTECDDQGQALNMAGTAMDITERKQAGEALAESERQMKSIFNAANDAIFIVDPLNDEIVNANPKAAELLDYTIKELKGMSMSAVHPDEMNQLAAFADGVLRQGKGFTNELHCKTRSGAVVPAEVSASLIQYEGRLLMLAMVRDISERIQADEIIRQMAYHDHLTGLPNRALFYDRLQQAVAHTHRNSSLMAVLLLDLDHFKPINDELGHEYGDQALVEVARRLLQCVPRATDTVARIGGDEFSVVLVDIESEADACRIAEKLIATIGQPLSLKKTQYTLGVSIGICMASGDDNDMESIVGRADAAMYRAKSGGKACYRMAE